MNQNRTLIAFVTKSGVTGENAKIISNTLHSNYGFEVDVIASKTMNSSSMKKLINFLKMTLKIKK